MVSILVAPWTLLGLAEGRNARGVWLIREGEH